MLKALLKVAVAIAGGVFAYTVMFFALGIALEVFVRHADQYPYINPMLWVSGSMVPLVTGLLLWRLFRT